MTKTLAGEKFLHKPNIGFTMSVPYPGNIWKKDLVFEPMDEESAPQNPPVAAPSNSPLRPPPSSPHPALFGPDGLRAGWRLLCYVAMVVVTALLLNFIVPHILHRKLAAPWSEFLGEISGMFVAFVPALLMARLEQRNFGAYGLPAKDAFRGNFWVGALWGFAAISVLLLGIRGVGDFSISGLALHGIRILKFGVFWAVVFLCVGFFEEFLMRGYTQFTLTKAVGFWPAATLLSLAFGALHLGNTGENRVGIVAVVMIALFLCLTLRRTGNLWFAVGFHAAFDWGESYFYSVPDSGRLSPGHLLNSAFRGSHWITGGSDGPEGSIFVFALILLLCIAFDRIYPEAQYQA